MRNTIICFSHSLRAIPYFASLGNEIVVRIDDESAVVSLSYFGFVTFFPPMRSLKSRVRFVECERQPAEYALANRFAP
jgi:hypothetical protein